MKGGLGQAKTIFMLGIEGSGMRGLAYLLDKRGKGVRGVDRDYDQVKAEARLARSEVLIYSDAVDPGHPLRQLARQKDIPELAYHEALGELTAGYTTIAVAGTHGKSSTTAMLAHIMIEKNLDPTVLVGANVPDWGGRGARAGGGKYFVVEADEYRDHWLALKPSYVIITTIDYDHPDYFASLTDVQKSFDQFLRRVDPDGSVVTAREVKQEHSELAWPKDTTLVDYVNRGPRLSLSGEHMRHNAALAIAMAKRLGIKENESEKFLNSWPGLSRRLEQLGYVKKLLIVSDYGHHPAEIAATLTAAREKYPGQKILVLFEAHTMGRLKVFGQEFVKALSKADGVLLVPVFIPAGREQETAEAKEKLMRLEQSLTDLSLPIWRIDNYSELGDSLGQMATKDFNVALAFSAGMLDSQLRSLVD